MEKEHSSKTLPLEVRMEENIDKFKRQIKTLRTVWGDRGLETTSVMVQLSENSSKGGAQYMRYIKLLANKNNVLLANKNNLYEADSSIKWTLLHGPSDFFIREIQLYYVSREE